MHVLHVVLGLEIGGLEAFVLDLSRAYQDSVRSTIVCLRGRGEIMEKDTKHATILYLEGPENFSWALVRQLITLIRRESVDIVHTHNPGPHLYGALAGRLSGRPVIHTKHGRNYPDDPRKVILNRVATMLTHRIIAVSQDAEQVCSTIESVPKHKLTTILNGTDIEAFAPAPATGALKRELAIAETTTVIGIVARLSRVKNHKLLFRSIKILKDEGVDTALVVVGDGVLAEDLSQEVRDLDLQSTVFFLGARGDVHRLYPEFDIFVLSSISEGVSLTLLEAMSCELPVVATRVGGNPEVVDDSVTGYVVGEDADEIAGALRSLIVGADAGTKRREMGQRGRQRVIDTFSMDKTASAYLEEYRGLLKHSAAADKP